MILAGTTFTVLEKFNNISSEVFYTFLRVFGKLLFLSNCTNWLLIFGLIFRWFRSLKWLSNRTQINPLPRNSILHKSQFLTRFRLGQYSATGPAPRCPRFRSLCRPSCMNLSSGCITNLNHCPRMHIINHWLGTYTLVLLWHLSELWFSHSCYWLRWIFWSRGKEEQSSTKNHHNSIPKRQSIDIVP